MVVQVYGWLFDDHGRVLVQDTPDGHNLPGRSPELVDADPAAKPCIGKLRRSPRYAVILGYELAGLSRAYDVRSATGISARVCMPPLTLATRSQRPAAAGSWPRIGTARNASACAALIRRPCSLPRASAIGPK